MTYPDFKELVDYVRRIPAVNDSISTGIYDTKNWWIKFSLDVKDTLAWNVVQELSHVINYLSLNEKLPTIFYPVSAPPYLNGGPEDYLYWMIESKENNFTPDLLKEWLEARLPNPVEDISEWAID